MKNGKKAGLYAVILMTVFIVIGCGSKNTVVNYQEPQEDITAITFFGNKYEPENVAVIEEIISDFMKDNPDIRVSYESVKGTEYYEALEKRMAAGKGDDVFMVNHDSLLEMEKKGYLADLSGLSTISDYTDQMLSQMKENEMIYWVPTTVSAFGLYCNMDLLEKYGQKIPENLREWERSCDDFTRQGITPIICNNDISLKTMAIGTGFFAAYEGNNQKQVFDLLNSGERNLSEYLTNGFSIAEDFIQKGYIDAEKSLATKKTSEDLQEFVKGESPFMLTGAWAAGRVKGMDPKFEFQVIPYPLLEDGSFVVVNADTRLSVNANSIHLDAAMKFVEYFTQAENIQKFVDQQSSLSPLKNGAPSSAKEIYPLISCYQAGRTVIGTDGMLNLPIWDLTAEVSKKILSGEPAASAAAWMDQQVREGRSNP